MPHYIGRVDLFNVTMISTFYSELGSARGSLTSTRKGYSILYRRIEQQQYMWSD